MRFACTALSLFLLAAPFAAGAPITFTANLTGLESGSPGTGFTTVIFDPVAHTLNVAVTFSGLISTTTAAHIHCCTAVPDTGTAAVATQQPAFEGFPLGVTSGSYNGTFDTLNLATYNPAFVTGHGGTAASAEAALSSAMLANETYLNIHTMVNPGGEISGFLHAPEPGTMAMGAIALAALWTRRRRR